MAAAGTIFALVEDPEGVKKVWNNIPDYLDSGHSLLGRFEKFVGELTVQGEKLRTVFEKAVRQASLSNASCSRAFWLMRSGVHAGSHTSLTTASLISGTPASRLRTCSII